METHYPPHTLAPDPKQGDLELKPGVAYKAEQRAAVPNCPFCLTTHLTMQAYKECMDENR